MGCKLSFVYIIILRKGDFYQRNPFLLLLHKTLSLPLHFLCPAPCSTLSRKCYTLPGGTLVVQSDKPFANGGEAKLFLAFAPDDSQCVLKEYLPNKKLQDFNAERDILSKIGSHPLIIQLLDAFQTETFRFNLVMELGPTSTLGHLVETLNVELSCTIKMAIFLKIADAISYIHSLGVVYADIKPENILMGVESRKFVAKDSISDDDLHLLIIKVTDFGLSAFTSDEKSCKSFRGTIDFVSPEALLLFYNRADPRGQIALPGDVWSFGVLCAVVCGHNSLTRDNLLSVGYTTAVHLQKEKVHEGLGIVRGVMPAVAAFLEEMLSFDAADRPSMSQVFNFLMR